MTLGVSIQAPGWGLGGELPHPPAIRYNGGIIAITLPRAPELGATLPAPDRALPEEPARLRRENAALRTENATLPVRIRELEAQ
jgi:hypothetical protein